MGSGAVYFSSFAMFILSAVMVWMVRINSPVKAKPAVTLKSLFASIAFILSKPAIMGAISLDLFAMLLGGATALLPIYAHDIQHTDSVVLGMLRSAPAISALTIYLLLAKKSCQTHHVRGGRLLWSGHVDIGGVAWVPAVAAGRAVGIRCGQRGDQFGLCSVLGEH